MHHDPTSARQLVDQSGWLTVVLWLLIFLLLAFVLALSLQNRDARQRIEELQDTTDLLSARVSTCGSLRDDFTDLEKRVTGVEAQFWE